MNLLQVRTGKAIAVAEPDGWLIPWKKVAAVLPGVSRGVGTSHAAEMYLRITNGVPKKKIVPKQSAIDALSCLHVQAVNLSDRNRHMGAFTTEMDPLTVRSADTAGIGKRLFGERAAGTTWFKDDVNHGFFGSAGLQSMPWRIVHERDFKATTASSPS